MVVSVASALMVLVSAVVSAHPGGVVFATVFMVLALAAVVVAVLNRRRR